jgi:hypothetical protein
MTVAARVRAELAKRAPRVEQAAVRANWRRRNRGRGFDATAVVDPVQRRLAAELREQGFARTTFEELVADPALFAEAAAEADRLYEQRPRERRDDGGKESYLLKLASGRYPIDHPFVRIALHPAVLRVANGYLGLRSTLRALELWYTWPTSGPAIQTQLWHRDADDVMNVKFFLYFTDVTRAAGPLTYAARTHPLGSRRETPGHDEQHRSTDAQMAAVVPEREWAELEGPRGTVVFAETCGYHKQLKPESAERVKLVAQYVSGATYVPQALELEGVDPGRLNVDQHYAVFDRPPR